MPRLEQNINEERKLNIKATIEKHCRLQKCKKSGLADIIGISQSAWYIRWGNPDLFRIAELRRIYEFLNVPAEERSGLV